MFVAGLNPFAGTAFAAASLAIAVPATAKVLSWLATSWRARPLLTTPMLFALGFVSLFISGGLSGIIVAQPILDEYLHNTFFIVGHFHLIMAMAGVFGLFCATYYWFPLLAHGRMLSERLGKWHFWLTLLFAYTTFLPMYFAGLAGEPRHYAQLTGLNPPAQALLGLALCHPAPHHRRSLRPRPHPTDLSLQPHPHPALTRARDSQPMVRHHHGMGTSRPARALP